MLMTINHLRGQILNVSVFQSDIFDHKLSVLVELDRGQDVTDLDPGIALSLSVTRALAIAEDNAVRVEVPENNTLRVAILDGFEDLSDDLSRFLFFQLTSLALEVTLESDCVIVILRDDKEASLVFEDVDDLREVGMLELLENRELDFEELLFELVQFIFGNDLDDVMWPGLIFDFVADAELT